MQKNMVFMTEAVPLVEIASGAHGVSRHIVNVLGKQLALVVSRRLSIRNSKKEIVSTCFPVPVFLLPDLAVLGLRRFFPYCIEWLNAFLFLLGFPILLWQLRCRNISRVFSLLGADATFLPILCCVALFYPVEVYLMDDIESTAQTNGRYLWARMAKVLEKFLYNRCDKVYVLSEGFSEHIWSKYKVKSHLLPLPSTAAPSKAVRYVEGNIRYITFVGAVNQLYMDALRDFYLTIVRKNATRTIPFKLRIISYNHVSAFLKTLPDQKDVEVHFRLPHDQLCDLLRKSWACLLPYSFAYKNRDMVSTSFSCKILEYFQSGRPIMAFGPKYASIPRYFKQHKIPLLATNALELKQILDDLEHIDIEALVAQYQRLWRELHSIDAFQRALNIRKYS